jgi:hypothetical protein
MLVVVGVWTLGSLMAAMAWGLLCAGVGFGLLLASAI